MKKISARFVGTALLTMLVYLPVVGAVQGNDALLSSDADDNELFHACSSTATVECLNCYDIYKSSSYGRITLTDLASGKDAYLLNGKSISLSVIWRQDLAMGTIPYPDPSRAVVLLR